MAYSLKSIESIQLDISNKFYEKRVPIIGYISLPNSKELVNLIRAELCDFELTKSSKSSLLSNIYDISIDELKLFSDSSLVPQLDN